MARGLVRVMRRGSRLQGEECREHSREQRERVKGAKEGIKLGNKMKAVDWNRSMGQRQGGRGHRVLVGGEGEERGLGEEVRKSLREEGVVLGGGGRGPRSQEPEGRHHGTEKCLQHICPGAQSCDCVRMPRGVGRRDGLGSVRLHFPSCIPVLAAHSPVATALHLPFSI